MKKLPLLRVGTSGMSNEGDRNRVILVNSLCLVCALAILVIGSILCYYVRWRAILLIPFIIEFLLNGSVIVFNYYKKHITAAIILYFLQCVMIIYLGALLGRLLQLELVVILLFAISCLIFRTRLLRRIAVITALFDLIALEMIYYLKPSPPIIPIAGSAAYVIQILLLAVMSLITFMVYMPYIRSNDANEELKRANHFIKVFVAQVTHELRTPLDSIHHVTQLLRKEVNRDQSLKKIETLVDIGYTVSSNARDIINNVLDMAGIEAGKMPATVSEAFKVIDYFEKSLEVYKIIARKEDMRLELVIAPDMPEVIFGDPININQILTNLLANALKYGSKESTVRIDVTRQTLTWQLKVINAGPGIAADKIASIFDPFVTGRTGQTQGSGLGLFIVKSKVDLMNGSITVQSEPGAQTCFTVTLPLREGKPKDLPEEPDMEMDTPDFQKIDVLIAEDDKLNAFLISRTLKDMKCSHTMVRNGAELIDAAQKRNPAEYPDIIILDCHMPVLNGEETIRQLKNIPGLNHIPIIVTTGDIYSDTLEKALAAGADAYLKKPIDHLALRKTMGSYLKKMPLH